MTAAMDRAAVKSLAVAVSRTWSRSAPARVAAYTCRWKTGRWDSASYRAYSAVDSRALQLLVDGRVHAGPGGRAVHGEQVTGVGGERLGLAHRLGGGPAGLGAVEDVGQDRLRLGLGQVRLARAVRAGPGDHVRGVGRPAPGHGHIQGLAGQ